MDLIEFIEDNPEIIPYSLAIKILNAKESNEEYSFTIDENGYLIKIKFQWDSEDLLQYISIRPNDNRILGNKRLNLNFQPNRYKKIWNSVVSIPFEVKKVEIFDFQNTESLDSITIDGAQLGLDVFIKDVHSKINIRSCHNVILQKLQSSSIEISQIEDLTIKDVISIDNRLSVCITNSHKLVVSDLNGRLFKLIGKINSANLQHSNFEQVSLVEPTFSHITFYDFDVEDFSIEMANQVKKDGHLEFTDSNITNSFKLQECQLGRPSLLNRIIDSVFKKSELFPIYIDIKDNRINPKKVEFVEVDWCYNGVINDADYPEGKRKLINQAKNYYSKHDDIYNTQLLYSFEKIWYYKNSGFKLPLFLSKWSNNFGLNLWWPILWLFFFILIESIIILRLSWNCYGDLVQNWGVFAHLVNPTHSTSIFLEVLEGKCNPPIFFKNWLPVVDNSFRILIAYSIFQFANAFRYKFKLR